VKKPTKKTIPPKKGKLQVDEDVLQAELQELVGAYKVRVTTKPIGCAVGVTETDKEIQVNINLQHIRTQRQLDEHVMFVRSCIGGGIGLQ